MVKCLSGLAAAAVLAIAAAPSPANAFAARHAPGVLQDQASVDHVQYGYYPRRYRYSYRYGRPYGAYPYVAPYAYAAPYGYAAPYPYYRRYYAPRPFVGIGIGPFGFGAW